MVFCLIVNRIPTIFDTDALSRLIELLKHSHNIGKTLQKEVTLRFFLSNEIHYIL